MLEGFLKGSGRPLARSVIMADKRSIYGWASPSDSAACHMLASASGIFRAKSRMRGISIFASNRRSFGDISPPRPWRTLRYCAIYTLVPCRRRQAAGGVPTSFLKARLKATSDP